MVVLQKVNEKTPNVRCFFNCNIMSQFLLRMFVTYKITNTGKRVTRVLVRECKYYTTLYILYTSVFIVLFFNCCIIVLLADNREYLMKSSLIEFIEKYKDSKLSDSRLYFLWKKEIDNSDFDRNEKECWEWFKKSRVN